MAGDDPSLSKKGPEISPDMQHAFITMAFRSLFSEDQIRDFLQHEAKEERDENRTAASFTRDEVESAYRKVGRLALGHSEHEKEEDHPLAQVFPNFDPPENMEGELKVGDIWFELDDAVFRKRVRKEMKVGNIEPLFPTVDDVRCQAHARATGIMQQHRRLQAILARHEETITKRWAKKSKQQRLKILLQAWPGTMNKEYQYYIDTEDKAVALQKGRKSVYTKADQEGTMWPHINQTDLTTNSGLLPLFIKSRGRNNPGIFWTSDYKGAFTLNQAAEACGMIHLSRHVLKVHEMTLDPDKYAELINFESKEQAMRLMRNGGEPVGYAVLVLAIQERTLEFLVHCCESILHDIPRDKLLGYPVVPEPTQREHPDQALPSLSEMVLEARYDRPKDVDILRIKALLLAKRSAAEDHMCALREDPSYFLDTMQEAMSHRYEHLKDEFGAIHPDLKAGQKNRIWRHVINNVVAAADWHLEAWSNLYSNLVDVEKSFRRYANIPKDQAPKPLRVELDCLFFFLDRTLSGLRAQLRATIELSPNIRQYHRREEEETTVARRTGLYTPRLHRSWWDEKLHIDTPEEELICIVYYLTEDVMPNCPPSMHYLRFSSVLHKLSQLIENKPRAKRLVSSLATKIIADMSVISEALRQLMMHNQKPGTEVGSGHMEAARAAKIAIPWISALDVIEASDPEEFYALCMPPDDGRFYYPSEKRRTQQNHEAMRTAEINLDAFWKKFDTNTDKGQQRLLPGLKPRTVEHELIRTDRDATKALLKNRGDFHRLGPWVEPTQVEEKKKENVAPRPLSDVYFELERSTEQTIARDSPLAIRKAAMKKKTRGVSSSLEEDEDEPSTEPLPPSQQPDIQPTFALNARAHKVFKTLFFNPDPSSTPGEVPWLDFVYAMTATGFRTEKLYGSVWQFKPTNLDVERGILFHEPHPSGKIPYKMCRNFGARLNRTYGWRGSMFVLAEKKA